MKALTERWVLFHMEERYGIREEIQQFIFFIKIFTKSI